MCGSQIVPVCCNFVPRLRLTSDLTSSAAVSNVSSCKYLSASYSMQAEKPSAILVVVACKNVITNKLSTVEVSTVAQIDYETYVRATLMCVTASVV